MFFSFLDISKFNPESGRAEHHVANSSTVLAANGKDAISTSLDLESRQKPSVSESVTLSKTTSSGDQAKMLCVSVDRDGHPKIVTTPTSHGISPDQSTETSAIDLGLIPPPSDFMDDPCPLAQPEKVKGFRSSLGKSPKKPGATVDLEQLRQRASVKRTQESSQENPPEVSLGLNQPALTSSPQMGPPPEAAELKGPPVVAPKPKKLPANIILKSHKVSTGSESNSGTSIPTNDRVLLDPQRVRFEALRKLGLIKSVETDSDSSLSPKHSPKDRRSWPSPSSSPVIPGAPHTPPLTPSGIRVNTPPPASVSTQTPAAVSPSVNLAAPPVLFSSDILPAPAAFSDHVEPLVFNNKLSAVKDVSEAKVDALANTPPLTPPALTKQLTPLKIAGVKSATLERSGPDLSSYMAALDSSEAGQGVRGEETLSQLHNSRPRPASLGSKKEFSSAQGEDLQAHASSKEPDLRRSLGAQTVSQQSRDSQKLPRSQGISVLITPRENGEDRRKALKKLGLLRD